MLGQLAGMATMAVAYYFGTSQATSEQRDAWLGERADRLPTDEHTPRPFDTGRDLPRPEFGED